MNKRDAMILVFKLLENYSKEISCLEAVICMEMLIDTDSIKSSSWTKTFKETPRFSNKSYMYFTFKRLENKGFIEETRRKKPSNRIYYKLTKELQDKSLLYILSEMFVKKQIEEKEFEEIKYKIDLINKSLINKKMEKLFDSREQEIIYHKIKDMASKKVKNNMIECFMMVNDKERDNIQIKSLKKNIRELKYNIKDLENEISNLIFKREELKRTNEIFNCFYCGRKNIIIKDINTAKNIMKTN